jgi:hypothetical protein
VSNMLVRTLKIDRRVGNVIRSVLVLFIAGSIGGGLIAQNEEPSDSKESTLISTDPSYPTGTAMVAATFEQLGKGAIRVIKPGFFEIGLVRLDRAARSIQIPVQLNQRKGPLEYFLVTSGGKRHESLFSSPVSPYDIHVAMLLLGAKGREGLLMQEGAGVSAPSSGAQIREPSEVKIPGDPIEVIVEWMAEMGEDPSDWKADPKGKPLVLRELIAQPDSGSELGGGEWVYNGSSSYGGVFHAQLGGSLLALITDDLALVNYVGQGHEDDEIWTPNTDALPEVGAGAVVTLKLK